MTRIVPAAWELDPLDWAVRFFMAAVLESPAYLISFRCISADPLYGQGPSGSVLRRLRRGSSGAGGHLVTGLATGEKPLVTQVMGEAQALRVSVRVPMHNLDERTVSHEICGLQVPGTPYGPVEEDG